MAKSAAISKLARVDRGQAVNLARNLLDDPAAYTKLTPKGIYRLVEAVLQMDKALLEIAKTHDLTGPNVPTPPARSK